LIQRNRLNKNAGYYNSTQRFQPRSAPISYHATPKCQMNTVSTLGPFPVAFAWTVDATFAPSKGLWRTINIAATSTARPSRQPCLRSGTAGSRLALAHRRAHGVRGHWRLEGRHPRCKGRKSWIIAHQRGDASRGLTLHSYLVKHAMEQANDPAISRGSRDKAMLYPLSEGPDAWHHLEKPLLHRRAKD
jgi:hypothetical protein